MDNFSLVQGGLFGGAGQKLSNGGLNTPVAPAGFTITNSVADNFQFSTRDFANVDPSLMPPGCPATSAFGCGPFRAATLTISQTVPGVVGDQYTFSIWSKWEVNYRGADPNSTTHDFLQIEFLNSGHRHWQSGDAGSEHRPSQRQHMAADLDVAGHRASRHGKRQGFRDHDRDGGGNGAFTVGVL